MKKISAPDPRRRNIFISIFVVLWLCLFQYESLRYFYLNAIFQRDLPKTKFLFPPAGWIMFYSVDETYSHVAVYGRKGGQLDPIDPHDILRTRTIGFDNIRRNVLSVAGSLEMAGPFCKHLWHLMPAYDDFFITAVYYPSIVNKPYERRQQVLYRCNALGETR